MSQASEQPQFDYDPRWSFTFDGWDVRREPAIEAICSLVNGYVGVRAAVEEGSGVSTPGTFLNGVFDASDELVAQGASTPEYQVIAAPTPELVKMPDWSRLTISVDGTPLHLETSELLHHRRTLDMRAGVLHREWRLRVNGKTTRLRTSRFVSLADRRLLGQRLEIIAEGWSGEITLEAMVDADVSNEGVRHLVELKTNAERDSLLLTAKTKQRGISVCMATQSQLKDAFGTTIEGVAEGRPAALVQRWSFTAKPDDRFVLEKFVAVSTSRDGPEPERQAVEHLDRAAPAGWRGALKASSDAWDERWQASDVQIEGDDLVQQQVRFALYHLIGCANPEDEFAAPGARSLTGERYKGHVFWDTDIFVLPFFVFTHPPTARAILMYRFHTLPAARQRARTLGYDGALYAWESVDDGVDVTPSFVINAAGERLEILTGAQEHHISADVAYGVCQYLDATRDTEFLKEAGAEMLFEIARFWISRAVRDGDGHLHIRGVIGPDEYHESVDNNAYTNGMARFVLQRAGHTAARLQNHDPSAWEALSKKIGLTPKETAAWADAADKLVIRQDTKGGLIEQHSGYFDLDPVDLKAYEPRSQTMDVLMGWKNLTRTQTLKQADVLMLLALRLREYTVDELETNYRYYEPRTSHDSSLSASVHSLIAARIGAVEDALTYLRKAGGVDLNLDEGVTAAGGVHLAALGGMWQALIFGFLGVVPDEDRLRLAPNLPPSWRSVGASLEWRGIWQAYRATQAEGRNRA